MYDSMEDGSAHLFRGVGMKEANHIQDADIIVFNGGADIGTELYGENPILNRIPLKASQRDRVEREMFNLYPDKFKIGICRGAQFLNCLNGGTLWQDVDRHGMSHPMVDLRTGEKVMVTSTHHQMMRPAKHGEIIGIADEADHKDSELDHYPSKKYPDDNRDTEIVWYQDTRSLCVQGHPEYVPGSHFAEYFFRLVDQCYNEVNHVAA